MTLPNYKDYNNYPEQDKDSMRTHALDKSNDNEETIIGQTDQVETLLSTIITKLETLHADVDQVETKLNTLHTDVDQVEAKIDAVNTSVQNADTHIVAAIQSQ